MEYEWANRQITTEYRKEISFSYRVTIMTKMCYTILYGLSNLKYSN